MSLAGTFETCRRALKMSAYRGGSEVVGAQSKDAFDPERQPTTKRVIESSR